MPKSILLKALEYVAVLQWMATKSRSHNAAAGIVILGSMDP